MKLVAFLILALAAGIAHAGFIEIPDPELEEGLKEKEYQRIVDRLTELQPELQALQKEQGDHAKIKSGDTKLSQEHIEKVLEYEELLKDLKKLGENDPNFAIDMGMLDNVIGKYSEARAKHRKKKKAALDNEDGDEDDDEDDDDFDDVFSDDDEDNGDDDLDDDLGDDLDDDLDDEEDVPRPKKTKRKKKTSIERSKKGNKDPYYKEGIWGECPELDEFLKALSLSKFRGSLRNRDVETVAEMVKIKDAEFSDMGMTDAHIRKVRRHLIETTCVDISEMQWGDKEDEEASSSAKKEKKRKTKRKKSNDFIEGVSGECPDFVTFMKALGLEAHINEVEENLVDTTSVGELIKWTDDDYVTAGISKEQQKSIQSSLLQTICDAVEFKEDMQYQKRINLEKSREKMKLHPHYLEGIWGECPDIETFMSTLELSKYTGRLVKKYKIQSVVELGSLEESSFHKLGIKASSAKRILRHLEKVECPKSEL